MKDGPLKKVSGEQMNQSRLAYKLVKRGNSLASTAELLGVDVLTLCDGLRDYPPTLDDKINFQALHQHCLMFNDSQNTFDKMAAKCLSLNCNPWHYFDACQSVIGGQGGYPS